MSQISVVINTWNEEKNIKRCLKSIRQLADEIVVVDMGSEDRTAEIAKKLGAKVYSHQWTGYVETARNFALAKASGDWLLVLDADEEIPPALAKKLKKIAEENKFDFIRLPRKNIIFGQWLRHSRWWPDYVTRFFKKGKVSWSKKIHQPPKVKGRGRDLMAGETNAIIHHNYQSISQYLKQMDRYTDIQAEELVNSGYKFSWPEILKKPTDEFLSRFFAGQGYKDGLHGLALSLLQAFSELVLYLKVWEKEKFKPVKREVVSELEKSQRQLSFWLLTYKISQSKNYLKKLFLKIKRRLL